MIGVRIDPAAAKAKLDSGEAIALDVTSSLVWPAVGHRIPKAIRVAPEPVIRGIQALRSTADILQNFAALPADKEVIAYCT